MDANSTAHRCLLRNLPLCRRGLTLAELTVSMAITTLMLVGMGSALVIAARSVVQSENNTAIETSDTRKVIDQITADLNHALTFTERTSNAATFTVPDRNTDDLPETIRYAWSGVAGDPLTRQYNNDAIVTIAEDVHRFDLTYLLRTMGPPTFACCYNDGSCQDRTLELCMADGGILQGDDTECATFSCPQPEACCSSTGACQDMPPEICLSNDGTPKGLGTDCETLACPFQVLFVVADASYLTSDESAKKLLIESWGYGVALISANALQADFDTTMANAGLVYISEDVNDGDLNTKVTGAMIGVVTEQRKMVKSDRLKIWEKEWREEDGTTIVIEDNTHYITAVFAAGSLVIRSGTAKLIRSDGNPAAGSQALASKVGDASRKTLIVMEAGDLLYDGSPAAGRRVALPWGTGFTLLTTDGQTLMRRAIEWAAGK